MAVEKILDDVGQEEFRKDWDLMTVRDLHIKYKVGMNTINKWSNIYGCTKPKKSTYSANRPRVVTTVITPQTIMDQVSKPDLGKVGFQTIEELKACNDEFMRIVNDTTMPKREKDTLLFNIAEKAMAIFISQQPSAKLYIECMADFYKLKLYERRIEVSSKEKTEIDATTLKNLKKKYIQEAFDAIHAELNDGEKSFFEHLVQLATDRILSRKKKENEAMQQRAVEASGQAQPEVIVEPIVSPEVVGS